MASGPKVRGSAFRMTLPYVLRFSGLWLLIGGLAVLALAMTSYFQVSDRLTPAGRETLVIQLAVRGTLVVLAMVGLAIFTTHRLAGPLIAIRRAFEDVRDGELDRGLTFRSSDRHLREVETAFEEMMASMRERIDATRPAGRA